VHAAIRASRDGQLDVRAQQRAQGGAQRAGDRPLAGLLGPPGERRPVVLEEQPGGQTSSMYTISVASD
jgi:hypothetical protein